MRVLLLLAVGVLLLACPASAGPETAKYLGTDILAELPGVGLDVHLSVGSGIAEAKKVGLSVADLRATIESILRKRGLPILPFEKKAAAPGHPYLHVDVGIMGSGFAINVTLNEEVELWRRSGLITAATWSMRFSALHSGSREVILGAVAPAVGTFAQMWQKLNPKKESPKK